VVDTIYITSTRLSTPVIIATRITALMSIINVMRLEEQKALFEKKLEGLE
jgi:hypothetical protein